MATNRSTLFILALGGIVAALTCYEWRTHGQTPIGGRARGFHASERDAQGGTTTINGKGYRTLPNGGMAIEGLTIETLRGTNGNMIVEAPDSIFDLKTRILYSTNSVTVRTADERLSIDGQGFQFFVSDSRLTISNNVHAVIHRSSTATVPSRPQTPNTNSVPSSPLAQTNTAPTKVEPIDIHSDHFDFLADAATFTGRVRAKDEQGNLTCGVLKALLETNRNSVRKIDAEVEVHFERGDTRTTSDKAVYLLPEDTVTLTGHPSWKVGEREGSGRIVIINNKTKEVQVEDDVNVKLPARSVLPLDWFSNGTATNAPPQSNQWVTVQSQRLNYDPTNSVFRGGVKILDPRGAELKCGVLTNIFSGPESKLAEVIMRDGVEFKQAEMIVRGEAASYKTNAEYLTLVGNPTWKTKEGEGKSEILFINPKTKQVRAERNVSMKLVGSGLEGLDLSPSKGATNTLVRTNQEFTIFSDELYYRTGSVIFLKNVRVLSAQDAEQELNCETLAAFFGGADNKLDQLVAEENVRVRQGDLRALGDRVDYWVTKGTLDLTGHPHVDTPGRRYSGDKIQVDRMHNTFRILGNYRIEVERSSVSGDQAKPKTSQHETAKKLSVK